MYARIDLVDDEYLGSFFHLFQEIQNIPVSRTAGETVVHQKEDDIHLVQSGYRGIRQIGTQLVFRFVNPRRVDKYDLIFIVSINPANSISGSLSLAGCNRDLLSDDRIQQRRFSHIRPSDNSYKT